MPLLKIVPSATWYSNLKQKYQNPRFIALSFQLKTIQARGMPDNGVHNFPSSIEVRLLVWSFWCSLLHKSNTYFIKASWAHVITCKLGWQPISSRAFTTPIWPLFTPMCSGVCRLLLRAFRSAPPRWSISITVGSSPNAAWWTARSPSLSYYT